ncbi:MAG: 3-deoxy-7-phosphoheptulonate synthase [Deltaproteobacteria bacterium]|nr:3-deoxy-7-phosphoheptulonate synthase [Deltaproteobacteria bacterium]
MGVGSTYLEAPCRYPPLASKSWSPSSWRVQVALQQPRYDDPESAERNLSRLRSMPPLVFAEEIDRLTGWLAAASDGYAFVLQAGDCAERFKDFDRDRMLKKVRAIVQMSMILEDATHRPVVRIGRMAGQFAKPRSSEFEIVNGVEIPVYRGDMVNAFEQTHSARRADPRRLIDAYFHSAATLNSLTSLVHEAGDELHDRDAWDLGFVDPSRQGVGYQNLADGISSGVDRYGSAMSLDPDVHTSAGLFTSHEGLVLGYEEAMTSRRPRQTRYYNLGAHFLWIGDRTRQLDGAHVEYFRGIANPIGVKVGPACEPSELARLVEILNPGGRPGRLSLLTRHGASQVDDVLPEQIRAVERLGIPVVWFVDPMHGNGEVAANGYKTRRFDAVVAEVERAFEIHRAEGTTLAGAHLELTGEDVTECLGGSERIRVEDLPRNYDTGCDPRLNRTQSIELALRVAELASAVDRRRR